MCEHSDYYIIVSNKFLTSEKLGNQLFVISYLRVSIKFHTSEKLGNSLIALYIYVLINPCIINLRESFYKTIVELKIVQIRTTATI